MLAPILIALTNHSPVLHTQPPSVCANTHGLLTSLLLCRETNLAGEGVHQEDRVRTPVGATKAKAKAVSMDTLSTPWQFEEELTPRLGQPWPAPTVRIFACTLRMVSC